MLNEKLHQIELSLKKIRFRHEVLSQLGFNSYKLVIQVSDIISVNFDQLLYRQDEPAQFVYFILYGALKVNRRDKGQEVCDIVRGGNVIGEESLFNKQQKCFETVRSVSKECTLLRLGANELIQMQNCKN